MLGYVAWDLLVAGRLPGAPGLMAVWEASVLQLQKAELRPVQILLDLGTKEMDTQRTTRSRTQ